MRTLTAGMAAHIAGMSHSRCWMIRLDLQDGTSLGLTSLKRNIWFDLGDGEIEYRSDVGMILSDVELSSGVEADNFELSGPLCEAVSKEAVLGGRFRDATFRLFVVNFRNLAHGAIAILGGSVGETREDGEQFTFECLSSIERLGQVIGTLIGNSCTADLGDAQCGVAREEVPATVISGDNELAFTVETDIAYADGYFAMGEVEWLTGALTGTRPVEIFTQGADGAIEMYLPLAATPEPGDTCLLKVGCSKMRLSADPTIRTCKTYDNVVNFRAFIVPDSDIIAPAIPGQGNGEHP